MVTVLIVVQNLCPGGSGEPSGALAAAIQKDFGSFEAMKNQLSAASVAVQVRRSPFSFFYTINGRVIFMYRGVP